MHILPFQSKSFWDFGENWKEWSNGKINKGAFQGTFQIEEQWVIMMKKYKHRSMEQYLSLEIDSAICKQYNKFSPKKGLQCFGGAE